MKVEPIINAKFNRFRDQFDLKKTPDGIAFERFVNYSILSVHQPDAFNGDSELFDIINVGGNNDMGIDGIAIKVNGILVRNIDEVKDLVERFKRTTIEFIFLQSKYKTNFDKGEYNNFLDGVREFLAENQKQPKNQAIDYLLEIKDYLLSENVIFTWEDNPTVRIYYVVMGKWMNDSNLSALANQFQEDVDRIGTYKKPKIHFIDTEHFKEILDSNENNFSTIINSIDTMPLTSVRNVENSCVILCYASELQKLLKTSDGLIRKSLFNDNVRDFQGNNTVNDEIRNTVELEPEKFALLNNGITIVCEEYLPSNRQVNLKNPQIVNGCQTCHVLYYSAEKSEDLSKVPVIVKVIATKSNEITNQIVRGTNRQNIVYDEAFETTKKFHKELEEFINALSNEYEKFYYERRSKQYQNNPTIKQYQKLNLRIIVQSFVAMFFNEPHVAFRHELKLLEKFPNSLFQDHQSKLPYFTAAYAFFSLEKLFRNNLFEKRNLYSYRAHVLMAFRELVAGKNIDINNEKMIDEHCQILLKVLKNDTECKKFFSKAIEIFENCKNIWIKKKRRSIYGIKDIKEFTELLLLEIRKITNMKTDSIKTGNFTYQGEVIKILRDRYGKYCGFIKRNPQNIFFHSKSIKGLNVNNLLGKQVTYKVTTNPKNNSLVATDIELINNILNI
ncbi:MAG: AIPR family protein [Ignavibacteria bacterium]|nr:AIPR family protein [Ignavibacteria bacterium]